MKIAFLFSGQGSQYPGMMKELYTEEDAVKNIFHIADSALDRGISALCFDGSQEELDKTHNTQPCVLAADLAAAMVLAEHGVKADGAAGFSLGEYAALAFSGAISMEQAFTLVQHRADYMQEAVPPGVGSMAAVIGVPAETVRELCSRASKGYVVCSNYNSPVQTIIAGSAEGCSEVIALAAEQGIRCMPLAVSVPSHCALMHPAAERLEPLLKTCSFKEPEIPIYMNANGSELLAGDSIEELLVRQLESPVQWVKTLNAMQEDGFDTFIECGPGKTLSGLVKKTLKNVVICNVHDQKSLNKTLQTLGLI